MTLDKLRADVKACYREDPELERLDACVEQALASLPSEPREQARTPLTDEERQQAQELAARLWSEQHRP